MAVSGHKTVAVFKRHNLATTKELSMVFWEREGITKQADRFILASDVSSIQVPDTIQGIIAARMDRLEESLKRIMQLAAVIGREFAFRILETITEMKQELKSGLINLQELEFIYEKSLFPELEYIFRHSLVQEVEYNSLLVNRRKEIHEKIGRAIEALYPTRLDEFCEMLAHHYSKSGNLGKAYEYLKASAEKAVRSDASIEGVRFYKQALEALSQLPQTDVNKREQIEVVYGMERPVRSLGWSESDYVPLLQKAEMLAEELGDDKRGVRVLNIIGIYYIMVRGDPDRGWKYLESCMDHPVTIRDAELMIPIGSDLCITCLISGQWRRVQQLAPTIANLIERSGTQDQFFGKYMAPYAVVLATWAISISGSGDFEMAERIHQKAMAHAFEINDVKTAGWVEWVYGCNLALKGDGQRAAAHFENALKRVEESQFLMFQCLVWNWLGYAYCLMGQSRQAVDLTEKGLKMHSEFGLPFCLSLLVMQPGPFSVRRPAIGENVCGTGSAPIEEAKNHIVEGIRLLEELGVNIHCTLGFLWLGEVCAESGLKEEALPYLKKAESMFETMGMDYWLAKAREVRKLVEKPPGLRE